MLDTNIYQTGILTRLMVKKFYQRAYQGKKSAIVTVSSVLSHAYTPGSVMYSASKAFITYFTMALGFELITEKFTSSGFFSFDENMIDIQCLCPGPVSNLDDMSEIESSNIIESLFVRFIRSCMCLSPQKVVEASLRDLCYGHINHSQRTFSYGHWTHDILRVFDEASNMIPGYDTFCFYLFEYIGKKKIKS